MIPIVYAALSGAGVVQALHFVMHHRTGLTAAVTVTCAWLATVIHLPLIAPHKGRHLGRRAPRTPLRVRVWRALAKRTGVPA